ncbi:protein SON isoform X2 [Lithobates pipiens]
MATNIEQIFRSFVVNKFKEIQEEGKLTSENSENSQNGELTAQKEEENTSESTAVCLQSEGTAPTCQDETMKTENLELAKPVTIALDTDSASKELKSAALTSDDEAKRDSSKKKSKKHKKHKSKKKKKKKKKEKHEKRSKSVSSVEDQENVNSETKSVWKPAFSSPPKEQGILDALSSKTETTNTVVLSSVNTQSISSAIEDKSTELLLDVDSGFFGPKCPNELGKNVSSNSVTCDVEIKEREASVVIQQSSESTSHVEKVSEIAKTQQSGLSLPIYTQTKSPGLSSPIDVNSEKDSLHSSNRCRSLSRSQSQSNCEKLQISKEKSRSNSRHRSRSSSLVKVQKCLETSNKSPKSLQRSYSISREQRKQSRSSSVGQRLRSTSRSSTKRQRSRSRDSTRYSKSPIRNWWSKSIRNRRRSVSVVKKPWSSTKSPARRNKSRSRSTEKRRCSRTKSRSPSRQRKSRSISRKYRQRSKSAKRRQSKSGSVSRIRRSRSVSGSRRRQSRSASISRRQRSWSGFAARRQRSRSTSAVKRHKSRSISLARRRRSRSASPGKRRSRSSSPIRRRRSRSASPIRRRRSRSFSPVRRRRSRSFSPVRRRRSRSFSPVRRRRSRSFSPVRRRRSRSVSPVRRRRSRSVSPVRRRRSRSVSPVRRRRSRSVSPVRRRRSRSVSPVRRRRSRSVSPVRRRRSRSVSPVRKRKSRSISPARRRKSRSISPARKRRSRSASPTRTRKSRSASHNRKQSSSSVSRRRTSLERLQRLSSSSVLKRQRSRSSSNARRQSTSSTSAARKGSRSTSPSTTRRPSQSNTGNNSQSPSGSVILKHKSRSVERKHKSRSRSTSQIRILGHTPLNESQLSISSTVKQTKPASSSETIGEENKLPQTTSESLFEAGTIYLDKTDTPVERIESSSENAPETDSCSVQSNENFFDSSFKASALNLPCSQFELNSQENNHNDKSDKEMLTSAKISVEPYKPFDQTSLDCTDTDEKLQSSPGDTGVFNDNLFQSSQRVSARLAEEPCDKIQKPDIVSVVENELENTGSEIEETCTTKRKDSPDLYKSTICDQYSMEKELPLSNQALPSDYSSLEAEGNCSFLDAANNQYFCLVSNPSPAEAVQHLECSNHQMSKDGDFKRHDSVTSPSTSTASCMEPSTESSRTLTAQDTSASHSIEHDIELNLIPDPLHHASLTSYITSDAGVKPNPFLAANVTSLESSLNNRSEIHKSTLKVEVSESYSRVDTNSYCHLKPENAPTPDFDLSSRDEEVLQNAAESITTPFAEPSHSIMSEQTYSEQTNKDISYGNTAESFSSENDFASQGLINENLTSIYDKADLLVSTDRAHPCEIEGHYINNPEVDLTQAETHISQSDLGDEPPLSPQKTPSPDKFPFSEDKTKRVFHKSGLHGSTSFTDGASSSRQVLEPVEQGLLDQSLYSSSENIECMPSTSNLCAVSSTADLGKEFYDKSPNCNEIPESIKIERSCPINSETHVDGNKGDSVSASEETVPNTISVGLKDLECAVSDKEQNLRCEAERESVPDKKMSPETCKMLIPMEMPSQKQMYSQLTDALSKTTVEPTDRDGNLPNVQYSFLLDNNSQNLDNIANSTNTNEACKDHGPDMFLSRDSKEGKTVAEKPFRLDMEAADHSQKQSASSYTPLNVASLSVKQNSGPEINVKPFTEEESNTKPVSKLDEKYNLEVDVTEIKKHGQVEYASYTGSEYVCSNTTEAQKISTSVNEMQKPASAMPLQFKFSKTFKTLASSQICNTSDESSDKETSKDSSLSLSTKASATLYVDSSRTNAKSPQHVLHRKQLDTPLLPEALQPESLSNVGLDDKDVLQQDIQTDDSQSSAAIKPAFPHISNALSKLGVKQRQYRSRSVAQDSRSPSVDRQRGSRSRSLSKTRKRRSRSKSVSRKKRSQSSSRKKSSHSKSAKNKRSRSKSRGRKRRSQSKSKSKKKHSPSKSGKRKRSRSKSSERVRSVGKPESSRSKSKTRRKGAHTKSPNVSRRSQSKSAVGKSSRTKNSNVKKTSRSKSGSSSSRSRSISVSRRHISHSKASLHRKHSRSSSKSTSPNKRSLSRNKGRSFSRSPARRHRSRSRSHTRRHRSRSRGRWRRSLSSSRKHSRSSSRASGTLSTKKRRSVSKSPMRGRRSRSQAKLKDKSPVTKRKSISPIPQKKSIQSKAAAFKHSIGLKSLIQKQLSQAKSQGSGGKLSKEQIPLSTIAARAQLPAANFSTRTQVSAPSLNTSQITVPNLAEVPLPSENGNGQIPVPNAPHEQQMSVTTLAPEAPLPVPDLTTATPWHVPDMASGAQWPVPDIAAGTQWSMSDLTAGAQWPMADLAGGSHWPMHDLSVGTQWSVPDLAAGTPWAVPDVATGAQWTVPDLTASTQWTVPDLTAGSQWTMTNFAPGAQWSVPDLAAAQWTVPDLTSGTHIQSADLAPEAQVPGSDIASEAQVPGSDLATEAQVPGSDLTAEAQVPRSDLVSEAQVPVPDHIPDTSDDDLVSEGHNLMPDVTAEALVPVASGTLVPDVAAGIPLPDVTAATQSPVPDVAATTSMPVPDVATTAHSLMPGYASYSAVHESVLDSAKPSVYLDISLTAGELVDSSCAPESLVYTKKLQSEALNRTEHQTALESLPSTDQCPPSELPLAHATVPEMSESLSQEEISVSSESQFESEHCSISNTPLFDPCLKSDNTLLIESTLDQGSSGMSTQFQSCTNSDSQLLPASDTDVTSVINLHADATPSLIHESCPSPVQSYRSPNHSMLVDPYHSPDNVLIEPYSSPERPLLVTQYLDSDSHVLTEPDAVSNCSVLSASCASSDHSPIVKTGSSHDHVCEELTEHHVNLDHLQKPEPCTNLPCPEPADCIAKPNYTEQANTDVSPSYRISGNRSAEPEIPHLVEPYGSTEPPQLVEPYASPEQPQLVEPYASPECPQLVEPYVSPEHPLLVEPYGSPDSQELVESVASQELTQVAEPFASSESPQIVQSCMSSQSPQQIQPFDSPDHPQLGQPVVNPDLVQPNSSPKSSTSPESPRAIQSCASLEGPQLVQPYANSEHKLEQPFADPEPILLEPFTKPEHLHVAETIAVPESPQVVQSSGSPQHPQLVQPYDSPEHPQLVQPYDSPEHPQLVQPYDSPERPQLVQPYDSPERPQLVQPYDSPERPQLVQPYDSPERPQLVQPYDSPERPQLVQPYDSPERPQLVQPYDSPERPQLVQPYDSPERPQLVQPYDSPERPQLVQPYDSPERPQLVQPYDSPERPQLIQPYDSPEHPQLVQPYDSPEHPQLVQPYDSPEHPQLVQPYDSPEHPQLVQPYAGPIDPKVVQSYGSPKRQQQDHVCDSPQHPQLVLPFDSMEGTHLVQTYVITECSELDQPHAGSEHLQLEEPYTSPKHLQAEQPHTNLKNKLAQSYTSPEHSQLVQPFDSQDRPKLIQPYESSEHLQPYSAPVQACASAEHPQLVETCTSPQHSQLTEPCASIAPTQLVETYSSHNHSQSDETNSSPDLSLDHGLSCHDDIDKNSKLMQSPLSDSRFDNSLLEKFDANTTGPMLDVPCSSILQKHKNSPKLSKPILEDCGESSYKISSEELYNAADKSLLGDSSESSVHLVSKEDYIDSDQFLTGDCHSSDATQLDRSTSSIHHLELDHSSAFHQSQLEQSLSGKSPLQLGVQYTKDDQQPEKKLDTEEDCADSDQPKFSEHYNSEEYSSPISCLNKECFGTNQDPSIDMNVSGQPLDEQNRSSTDQSRNDMCSDVQQINPISTSPEKHSMPCLDRATSDVYLTNAAISSIDALFKDGAVPSVEQKEQSDKSEGDKNLDNTEQLMTDKSTELFKCDLPDKLTDQTEALSDQAYSSPDNLQQNQPLEMGSYAHAENKSHRPNQSLKEHPLVRASKKTTLDASEQTYLDKDYSKNEQIISHPEIGDLSELDQTVEGSTSIRSEPLSPVQICSKPFAAILSAETEEPSTSLCLQIQDKVDSFMSVHVTTLSAEIDAHVAEDSGNVQPDHECKITPPDLLPFDSEQPTPIYTHNSESSSEPVLFISQPPPELLPYDSEQPANPFQSISDYSSEQDSSVFHTPPELLPYDSDQTIVHVSKPESCEVKLSLNNATDPPDKQSAAFVASENPFVSQLSVPNIDKETIQIQLWSAEEKDTSIISTKELDCVEYETSRSSIMTRASDLNNPEMVVEQPATILVEFGQELPSSLSSCDETKCMLEHPVLPEITTPHGLSQGEHSVEHSPLTEDSIKSTPPVSKAEIEQVSLILNTCDPLVVQSCSDNSDMVNFCEQEKSLVTQSPIVIEVSNERSRSKSLLKTELSNSLSTSTKIDSPSKRASRSARSHSRSKDRRKSRSKSTTRKKRSRSKSMTRVKKSRSKSVVRRRKSRSKSATRRKKSSSVSDTRFRRSRSRSKSRKRRSRSTSVTNKRSSRSPSAVHRRRSRSSRRKRSHSTSVDPKRSHSHSVARRRHSRSLSLARRRYSRSRSPVRRRRSHSSSVHRRKRSRSTSVARRRRSRSSSITRRRRSRSSSVSWRRPSPSQSVARRRRSPSLGRRRRSRSPSLAHRRRSPSASHRRRSRSPSASRRRRSPSAPRRRRSRSPSPPRRKRSSSAARKRRSHSTSVTRKRHSRSLSASRKRRSRSSSHKRHSQTPSIACKRRSESKSPTPKSPKIKQRAQSKSDRSRSRSQSNVIRKRKTRSRSSSRDINKSNEKRRKRSSSKEHYSIKQRRKSRTPPRRKKSRSPARRISPCRSPVRRRRSRSPVRRKSFSRSPVRRKRSRSRDQSMDCVRSPKRLTDLDKAQLLEIAKANAAAMCVKAGMPLPASLKPVLAPSAPVDEKTTHRTYGVTIQELTEKCKQIAQSKEDDEVVNKPHDSDEEEGDQPFYNHPFKVSEHKPISFSLLNPSLKPAPKTQVTLTKEFPVSSGSQHRKKESDKVYGEWVPVDKKTEEVKDDVFTNTGPSQPVDITAAMNERAMAQTRLTGNPFDLEALLMLNRAQEQIDAWAQSTSLPGQFTGSTGAQVLSADEISNSGPQAWLKKQVLKRDRTLV